MGNAYTFNDGTYGCHCVVMVAGEALSIGEVIWLNQGGTAQRVVKCPTTGNGHDMPCGVVAVAAANAGDDVVIAVSGVVKVLPEAGFTATKGYVIKASDNTAGRVEQSNAAPSAIDHFTEVGHWLLDGTGNGAATYATIHFL